MYTALEKVCVALAIASPALLLAARLVWRPHFPWWIILMAVAMVSTIFGAAQDHLGWYAHVEQQDACLEAMARNPSHSDCSLSVSYHVWALPWYATWARGIVVLVAWLPFYGLAAWLAKRHAKYTKLPQQSVQSDRREDAAPG
jgi:hypothetical protein